MLPLGQVILKNRFNPFKIAERFKGNWSGDYSIFTAGPEMSFCRILSTLYSHVVFHNIPHFSRGRQNSGTKSTSQNRRRGTFCPALLKSAKQIVNNHTSGELSDSLCLNNQTGYEDETEGFEREGLETERY